MSMLSASSIAKRTLLISEKGLGALESILLRLAAVNAGKRVPAVFIIGAPRTGTTLLYQLLASTFRLAYFTNFSAVLYAAPVLAMLLLRLVPSSRSAPERYMSSYGQTSGLLGPNEAARFWYRWFPAGKHVYVGPGQTPRSKLGEIRREIAGMAQINASPVLFKNTFNSMRVAPLLEAVPEASFLVCRRDALDTAQSILNGRIRATGRKECWWSLPPKEIDEIEQNPYWEQVVEQVYYTYLQIGQDRERFGHESFFDVSYKTLCESPRDVVEQISRFLRRQGVVLETVREVPTSFSYSTGKQVEDADYEKIRAKVQALWP